MKITDSLVNLVAQIGIGKAKTSADAFSLRQMTVDELASMYRSDWLGRKIVDVPVFDMLREWRAWYADKRLVDKMEEQEQRWSVHATVSRAEQFARLYGGGVILIGADTLYPERPLSPSGFGKGALKYLTAVARTDVQTPEIDFDMRSETFGKPKFYEIASRDVGSVRVHPSRVIHFNGADRLDPMGGMVDGWGDSVLAAAYDAIHHAALTQSAVAELIHEAKVDVISIPDLGSHLQTPDGTALLTKRFTAANALKSINNMLLLDEREKWDRRQTSFTGLPDVLDRYLQIVAGASDIPATRLLGQSPKGMSSTGESDLRNYYDMLAALRSQRIDPNIKRLDTLLWVDALGMVPKDAFFEWRPLWQLSEKERADIAKSKAETTQIYIANGVLDENTLRVGVENQLIEDSVYPGLEQAIEQLRLAGNDPAEEPEEEDDDPPSDRTVGDRGNGLPRLAQPARS